MTFAVERHSDRLWLVLHESPGCETSVLLAEFTSMTEVEIWKNAHARALLMARQVGASGLA